MLTHTSKTSGECEMIQSTVEYISAGTEDSLRQLLCTGNKASSCQFNIHTDK